MTDERLTAVLTEVEQHLLEDIHSRTELGTASDLAITESIQAFGDEEAFVNQTLKTYQHEQRPDAPESKIFHSSPWIVTGFFWFAWHWEYFAEKTAMRGLISPSLVLIGLVVGVALIRSTWRTHQVRSRDILKNAFLTIPVMTLILAPFIIDRDAPDGFNVGSRLPEILGFGAKTPYPSAQHQLTAAFIWSIQAFLVLMGCLTLSTILIFVARKVASHMFKPNRKVKA